MQPASFFLNQIKGIEYFQNIASDLHIHQHITTTTTTTSTTAFNTATTATESIDKEQERRILQDGYFTTNLHISHLTSRLAQGIRNLRVAGWPASFILMYDEAWELSKLIDQKMGPLTGNTNNGDMLAWDIDPLRNEAGFSPHRDRQPEDIPSSFHDNGMPKYSTAWVALTDATPDNSCLYVIPKEYDPGYTTGDLDEIDPLARCLTDKTCYQNIRALPIPSGHGIFFTHRILHWGSRGRKGKSKQEPRMALSVACSTKDYEPSYFADETKQLPFPEYNVRLGLICGQCICYHERFSFNGVEMKLFVDLWKQMKQFFSSFYQKKVLKELIPAIEEALKRDSTNTDGSSKEKKNVDQISDDSDDDMLDVALDAMLDGGGDMMDFHDDFDEAGEGVDIDDEDYEKVVDGDTKNLPPPAKRQKKVE